MTSVAAMYEVGAGIGTTDGLRDSSGAFFASAQLNLTSPGGITVAGAAAAHAFISPQWDLIASCFTKYRVKRVKFRYFPQSTTTKDNRLVFSFASDANHPLVFGAATQSSLEAVADSIPFAPWCAWDMDVTSKVSKDWMYTYDGLSPQVQTNISSYIERFASFGTVGCITAINGTAVTGDVFGLLYLELGIEFCEFCPVSVTRPALLERLHSKLKSALKERSGSKDVSHPLANMDVGISESIRRDRIAGFGGLKLRRLIESPDVGSSVHIQTTADLRGKGKERENEEEGESEYAELPLGWDEATWKRLPRDVQGYLRTQARSGSIVQEEIPLTESPEVKNPPGNRRTQPLAVLEVADDFVELLPLGDDGKLLYPTSPPMTELSDSELLREYLKRRTQKRELLGASPPSLDPFPTRGSD